MIEQLPEASKDGIPLIADTKLRERIPPGIRSCANENEKLTEFLDDHKRNDPPKDALNHVQCQPVDTVFPYLVHYGWAKKSS